MGRILLGIDEAGRGPAIGPMYFSGIACRCSYLKNLNHPLIKDSKTLSSSQRENAYDQLSNESLWVETESISARQIDQNSLTSLTRKALTRIIQKSPAERVIMDAPCHPAALPDLLNQIQNHLDGSDIRMNAFPSADQHYPIVSAASIVAKVLRDRFIQNLEQTYECDIGSGYPSDPQTRAFLKSHVNSDHPLWDHVRTRWKTVREIQSASHQQSLFKT